MEPNPKEILDRIKMMSPLSEALTFLRSTETPPPHRPLLKRYCIYSTRNAEEEEDSISSKDRQNHQVIFSAALSRA